MAQDDAPTKHIRFGIFEVDLRAGELRRNGTKVKLQEQTFQILQVLLENAGKVVTREELRARIWPADTFVDFDHGLYSGMTKLREALDDSSTHPRYIETIPRRGYCFIAAVQTHEETWQGILRRRHALWAGAAVLAIAGVLIWRLELRRHGPGVPAAPKALAVIEIENLSRDPSLDWLGDGVADLLTTDLAQARGLNVISTERVRGLVERKVKPGGSLPASQAQAVAREAGADVFVSGALLKVGPGIRLDLRVEETATGKVLLADKVEAENPQAVFSMVDEAASRIVSQLLPTTAVAANSAASLTSNLDALHAYEQGIGYLDRLLSDEATAFLRSATQSDPGFAMAYYQLSEALGQGGHRREARQALAQAAHLAQQQPMPEQQKVLIEAQSLAGDGRLDDSIQLLQAAVARFPNDLALWLTLGTALDFEGRSREASAALEKVLQIDPKTPLACNALAYSYAHAGDLTRALAAVDEYAALLAPDDPNPIGTRGDVYAINGQFDNAIAQYKIDANLHPEFIFPGLTQLDIALSYLSEGRYRLARIAARAVYENARGRYRGFAASVLGDIAVASGAFDRAIAQYTEAARILGGENPDLAGAELWKVAEIHFEQQRTDAALAWARRQPGPSAALVRGVADLLLKNEPAAEKEFAAARGAMAPLFGDYQAEKAVIQARLMAASYSGRWQEVISGWQQLPGGVRPLLAFQLGRAEAETGALADAEKQLRFALRIFTDWSRPYETPRRDALSYTLAQFYLAKVLEQEGKKAEAVNGYRAFLSQFENPAARLPQIPEAQAALKRLL